nr:DUF202 domain-containing protein [Gordonia sp. SID5947]
MTTERANGPAESGRADDEDGVVAGSSDVPGAIDARFTLAAERTVLAWVRTALGFMAAGVAVVYVADDIAHPVVEAALGLVMVGLGCVIALLGGWRWRRTMDALQNGGEMPGPSHVMFLIVGIVVIAVAIAVVITIQT